MIEKSIEANIIAAIQALNLDGLDIRGAWQAANAGEVKDAEDDSSPAALVVRVAPRAFGQNDLPEVTFDVALTLSIRTDLCPTGAALETYCDPVANLLQGWNLASYADGSGAHGFDVPGFAPGGIQLAGGSWPTLERDACLWAVVFNLVVSGTVFPVSENQTETE